MTCCYEKPVWRTCDLAGKDKVFDLSYDVLIVAVGVISTPFLRNHYRLLRLVARALEPCMWPS